MNEDVRLLCSQETQNSVIVDLKVQMVRSTKLSNSGRNNRPCLDERH